MVKKIGVTILLIILTMFSFITSSLAYEDELFKFDLPSNFANMSYQNIYFFADTSGDSNRGFMIYAYENSEMKKSVWDIDDNDLDDLLRNLGYSAEVVDTNKRAKLGKEKAVEVIVTDGEAYMDMYLLASNKYIYVVMFVGESRADLSNSDFQTVKNSFKLKDRTTNFRMVFLIIAIVIAVIIVIFRNKRNNKIQNYQTYQDYNSYKDYQNNDENIYKKDINSDSTNNLTDEDTKWKIKKRY